MGQTAGFAAGSWKVRQAASCLRYPASLKTRIYEISEKLPEKDERFSKKGYNDNQATLLETSTPDQGGSAYRI